MKVLKITTDDKTEILDAEEMSYKLSALSQRRPKNE